MREEGKFVAGQQVYSNRTKEYHRRTAYSSAPTKKQPFNHRGFLKVTLGVLLLCLFIWGWQKISNPQTMPIRTIKITGIYDQVDHAALRQEILPFVNKGFLWADTNGLQDRLSQLAWVYSVQVKRTWPDKLTVNIIQQQPVARMGNDILVNTQGDTFQVAQSTIPSGLPIFISPTQGSQKLILQNYKTMSETLAPLSVKIAALSLDARQSWSLQLDNGIVVILGKIDPMKYLQRFIQVYPQIIGNNAAAVSTVDLRYASGVAVRYKNQTITIKG